MSRWSVSKIVGDCLPAPSLRLSPIQTNQPTNHSYTPTLTHTRVHPQLNECTFIAIWGMCILQCECMWKWTYNIYTFSNVIASLSWGVEAQLNDWTHMCVQYKWGKGCWFSLGVYLGIKCVPPPPSRPSNWATMKKYSKYKLIKEPEKQCKEKNEGLESEGIIIYTFNVMLLVQCYGRTWCLTCSHLR